ncbi:MAG: diguanylate cyclase [Acidobacteriota bacterium]|nr:diguanylate cyclase [Acidobacteriota bacterium]MDE2963730.1 diguanylate cyclase [Acidobacteriota bacterium]
MQAAAAIARSLTAGLKPGEILGVIRDQCRPIIGGDCWALARLDREGQAWEVTAVGGQSDGGPEVRGRVPLDHPLLAPILEVPGTPVFVRRSPRLEAGSRVPPLPVAAPLHSLLPLMAGGHLAGALVLGHSTGDSLDRSDRDFLRLAADQAALALENAHLCEQVRASRARLASRQVALEHQLKRLTVTDDLTGLHNQRDLFEQLPREMERARRAGSACSLCLFDLDGFKEYNDTHGHLAGDRLLRTVGAVVSRTIRAKTDRAFRYGGDEFVLLLPHTSGAEAQVLVDRLRQAVSQALAGAVGFSAGIAEYSPGMESRDFIEAADRLMYRAKRRGGNRLEPEGALPRRSD